MLKKSDKIFIAGHNGLVGSAVLRKLKDYNYNNILTVEKSKLNLLDQPAVFKFLKKKECWRLSIAEESRVTAAELARVKEARRQSE